MSFRVKRLPDLRKSQGLRFLSCSAVSVLLCRFRFQPSLLCSALLSSAVRSSVPLCGSTSTVADSARGLNCFNKNYQSNKNKSLNLRPGKKRTIYVEKIFIISFLSFAFRQREYGISS